MGLKKKRDREWVLNYRVFGCQKVKSREGDVWIRLGLVGKMNEGYFRETSLFLSPHGFFINYLCYLLIILFK